MLIFIELLTEELNKFSIESNDFHLAKTKRGGLKLCSLGYYYTKERVTKSNTYHWKCENTNTCNGRAHTYELRAPVVIKVAHTHRPDTARKQKLINDDLIKEHALSSKENPRDIMIDIHKCENEEVVVQSSSYQNIRQIVSRARKNKAGFGANAK